MRRYLHVFTSGLLISFLGTLPIGTLNITAFQIAASKSITDAVIFALAVVLIELIVVRITLIGAKKINLNGKLSFYLFPLGVALLLYLAISSFMSLETVSEIGTTSNIFPTIQSTFILGLLLSALNPMHIPFWMGWNRVLINKSILDNKPKNRASYIIGIGLGSMLGILIFIYAGNYIFQSYQEYRFIITLLLSTLYLGFSLYLMFLFYKKHLKLKFQ